MGALQSSYRDGLAMGLDKALQSSCGEGLHDGTDITPAKLLYRGALLWSSAKPLGCSYRKGLQYEPSQCLCEAPIESSFTI